MLTKDCPEKLCVGCTCTTTVRVTEEASKVSVICDEKAFSAFDAIREYKQAIFDLYGELLTAIVELEEKRFAGFTDAVSAKIFQVRERFLLDGTDTEKDWLDLGTRFLSLQMRASEVDCLEVYGRAGFLVFRVRQLMQKMKRQAAV